MAGYFILQMCAYGIQCVYGNSLRLRVLRLLNLLYEVRKELLIIVFEVYLDVEDQGDEALQKLLVSQELLGLYGVAHFVRDFLELFEQDVVRAVDYDLCEACDGATLNILALRLFDHAESKFLEVPLE